MKVLALPAVRTKRGNFGVTILPNAAEEFLAFIRGEHQKWAKVVKRAEVKPE